MIQFIVNEQGQVENPTILRGIGGGCDEAALEAVKGVEFTPGMQRGRPVKVQFQLPIVFRLGTQDAPPPPSPPAPKSSDASGSDGVASVVFNKPLRLPANTQGGEFRGKVSDKESDLAMAGANISIRNADGSFNSGAATDMEGRFSVRNLADGNYNVTISYIGYTTPEFGIKVENGVALSANIGMAKRAYELQ